MRFRFLLAATAALAALFVAGCGGGGGAADPSSIAPPGSLVFAEGTVRPSGELKANVDAIAERIGGVENLGDLIVEQLESSARDDGEPFDFAKEVEPWLGERAGLFFGKLEDGDLSDGALVLQSTDTEATQEFIESQARSSKHPIGDASYEGVDYKVDRSDETVLGVVGDFLVVGEEQAFKDAVDTSQGDSLAGEDRFDQAISAAPGDSLADVYVDVGGIIRRSGTEVSGQALGLLKSAGIDPGEATVLASLVPGPEQLEVDLSSDLGGERASGGDASELLGSLPAGSFAALAVSGFGAQLEEALDSVDASGIPPDVPPHKLKSTLSEAGIDLDEIAASLRSAAIFAGGSDRSSLGGALVLTTEQSGDAAATVGSIGLFLRRAGVPGVTALGGNLSGFSISSPELGGKPLVVAAKGERIAIGYGLPAALQGLVEAGGATLSGDPVYRAAVASLGGTPISAFVDGPAALRLAESLVPASDTGFQEAKPYLAKIRFLALGSATDDGRATAKLIVGLAK